MGRRNGVVIDKSYLHRFDSVEAIIINEKYMLLMTESLLYEVSKDILNRARLFGNIQKISGSFRYIPSVNYYFEHELRYLKPTPLPTDFPDNRDYSLMNDLAGGDFGVADLDGIIERKKKFVANYRDSVIFIAKEIRNEFPDAFFGNDKDTAIKRERLNFLVATKNKFVRRYMFRLMDVKPGTRHALVVVKARKNWAHYRWAQLMLLLSINVGARLPSDGSLPKAFLEKIEHDIWDMQYVVPALLVGALATRDEKMKDWWRRLVSVGILFEGNSASNGVTQSI
jgi:hypothetical protein